MNGYGDVSEPEEGHHVIIESFLKFPGYFFEGSGDLEEALRNVDRIEDNFLNDSFWRRLLLS